jgi:hypothetical protein
MPDGGHDGDFHATIVKIIFSGLKLATSSSHSFDSYSILLPTSYPVDVLRTCAASVLLYWLRHQCERSFHHGTPTITPSRHHYWIFGSSSESLVLRASAFDDAPANSSSITSITSRKRAAAAAPVTFHQLDNIQRVFCLSDLHTDHVDNMKWLRDRMARGGLTERDLLIVAGDISHEYATLAESIAILKDTSCQVFFLAGNHEAWLTKQDKARQKTSLQKLDRVYETCRQLGVLTEPVYLTGKHPLWILPLECWYDGSLSFNEELCHDFNKWPWVDFARCDWPIDRFPRAPKESRNSKIPVGLVDYFLKRNRSYLRKLDLRSKKLAQTWQTQSRHNHQVS